MRPTGKRWLGPKQRLRNISRLDRIAKRCGRAAAQRLEGSRFLTRQLCKLIAGGSRERSSERQFYRPRPNRSPCAQSRRVEVLRWAIPGSRLPPSDRTAELQSGSPPGVGHAPLQVFIWATRRKRSAGLTLIELLVVLMIIAAISALITTSVLSALNQQNQRVCLNNMLTIEAAKDEYIRDHPGATSIDKTAFHQYFRFGIPTCPDQPGVEYTNLYSLTQTVTCLKHPQNDSKVSASPSPQ
jgi:prepilin-type N-terminal cleavage/methylation domain-containing protein